jgi:hypothetical protein
VVSAAHHLGEHLGYTTAAPRVTTPTPSPSPSTPSRKNRGKGKAPQSTTKYAFMCFDNRLNLWTLRVWCPPYHP